MKFVFVTLFPEQIEAAAGHSMLKRAMDTGILQVECINPPGTPLEEALQKEVAQRNIIKTLQVCCMLQQD